MKKYLSRYILQLLYLAWWRVGYIIYFKIKVLSWIKHRPQVNKNWSSCLQVLKSYIQVGSCQWPSDMTAGGWPLVPVPVTIQCDSGIQRRGLSCRPSRAIYLWSAQWPSDLTASGRPLVPVTIQYDFGIQRRGPSCRPLRAIHPISSVAFSPDADSWSLVSMTIRYRRSSKSFSINNQVI